jgi:hypothetical protein
MVPPFPNSRFGNWSFIRKRTFEVEGPRHEFYWFAYQDHTEVLLTPVLGSQTVRSSEKK